MGLLIFSINVTLDGCVDHQEGIADDAAARSPCTTGARADSEVGHVAYNAINTDSLKRGSSVASLWAAGYGGRSA